jgi:hypothetical protein
MADGAVQEIRYVCVARRSDNVVIAQRVHTPARTGNFFQNVKRVLDSPGWATITSDKLTLDDGENTFYVLIDEAGRAYIAVASKAYPARHIYDSNDGRTEGFLGGVCGLTVVVWTPLLDCTRPGGPAGAATRVSVSLSCSLVHSCNVSAVFPPALAREFQQRFGDATLTCAADEYTAKAKTILKELCDKYVYHVLPRVYPAEGWRASHAVVLL